MTTVVILPWVYHCGHVQIGVCGCALVVALGAICLCRVNKVDMSTVGFGIG